MSTAAAEAITHLAGMKPGETQIREWVSTFHRDGFVFIPDVLPPDTVRALREDLDRILPARGERMEHATRLFERSAANLALFDLDPVVSLAEAIIGEDESHGAESCHVVMNNSFRVRDGGGISGWHQDDSSHYKVTHGEPPTNVHLPCLMLTANYYLTDVPTLENGPGQAVPGSHLFGRKPPADLAGTPWEQRVHSCLGRAGGVMVFNNQLWHRGAPCTAKEPRVITQVGYGRRFIGHLYHPFMNYQMPEHCYAGADARKRRLLGFKPHGAGG
jgi:ectoine hydroxylase-related dioxygenase (phytanoyl-CoA dioxygenase family)